MTKCWNVYK